MLYRLLYIPSKLALWIFCRHITINDGSKLQLKGPLLIAANHPNSFLDAIIIASLFRSPVYSLARGDAFTKPVYQKLLESLKMFPVYRISEGAENLEHNYHTFEKCKQIFRKNGIVLIFSEGRCVNEWRLRPLKKGTARLAQSSWDEGIPLRILPTGINYQSFTSFGKNIRLNFGRIISQGEISNGDGYGKNIIEFNDVLRRELKQLVVEAVPAEKSTLKPLFFIPQPAVKKALLFFPAVVGYIVHAPLFVPVRAFCIAKGRHNDHYDSLMVGLLFLLYPAYLVLAAMVVAWLSCGWYWTMVFFVLPFCARSYVQLKKQF